MKILVLITKTSRMLNVNPIKNNIFNDSHTLTSQGTLIKLPRTYLNSNLNMYTLFAELCLPKIQMLKSQPPILRI